MAPCYGLSTCNAAVGQILHFLRCVGALIAHCLYYLQYFCLELCSCWRWPHTVYTGAEVVSRNLPCRPQQPAAALQADCGRTDSTSCFDRCPDGLQTHSADINMCICVSDGIGDGLHGRRRSCACWAMLSSALIRCKENSQRHA